MSFALTTEQIKKKQKTVTRRLGWRFLKAGDFVRAVEKCQGLKKGEKVRTLAHLCVTNVRREKLCRIEDDPTYGLSEIAKEGFAEHPEFGNPRAFVDMFCDTHECPPDQRVTRIEFEYVRV